MVAESMAEREFVGGPLDGARMSIRPSIDLFYWPRGPVRQGPFCTYRRYAVYRHCGLRLLFDGYVSLLDGRRAALTAQGGLA